MQPKYSVIVPVFNAESTLHRCIDSLLAERYPNMELILVNDGSKDLSLMICRDYAERFKNVRVIDKENGGVSTARNAGLDVASGEYILFVDSDDYVTNDYFFSLDNALKKAPCDWVQFSYCFDNGHEKRKHVYTPLIATSRTELIPLIINAICRKSINGPVAKVYQREIIEANHIRFPIGASVAEDRAFNIKYSFYVNSYAESNHIAYCVNTENENSLTRGLQTNLKQQFQITHSYFESALAEAPVSESEKEKYQRAVNFGDCRGIYHDAKLMHQNHIGWMKRQVKLGRICREINAKHMKYPNTRYCTLITLPVRLYLTPVIDAIAWKLTH